MVLVGRIHYRGKASGVEAESKSGYILKFRDGRLLRFRPFREPEAALEAVGRRELIRGKIVQAKGRGSRPVVRWREACKSAALLTKCGAFARRDVDLLRRAVGAQLGPAGLDGYTAGSPLGILGGRCREPSSASITWSFRRRRKTQDGCAQ